MLIFLPAIAFVIFWFLALSVIERGDWPFSLACGLGAAVVGTLVWVVVASINTGVNTDSEIRFTREVSDVNTEDRDFDTHDIYFDYNGKTYHRDTYTDNISILLDDSVEVATWQKVCDVTADWASPFLVGGCIETIKVPVSN